jgi:hypothetical protein
VVFEAWVQHVFDHEVREPAWYFDPDAPGWDGSPETTVAYVTRLLESPAPILDRFDDAQLNQGFWYLVGAGSSYMFTLTNPAVPSPARLRCVRSFEPVFRTLFASRCSPHLSHLDQPGANPLNAACYMWWDILPVAGAPHDQTRRDLDAAALEVMEAILRLDSLPCRESALHGLGHWARCYPGRAQQIIDAFLGRQPGSPAELVAYAKRARNGHVL